MDTDKYIEVGTKMKKAGNNMMWWGLVITCLIFCFPVGLILLGMGFFRK